MNKLAAYIMTGRWQAIAAVIGFAMLGLLLPPFTILSGAALGLVTLRLGAPRGLSVVGPAVLVLTALSAVAVGEAWIGLVYGVVQWVPLLLLTAILRRTMSLAVTLVSGTAIGLATVLTIKLLTPGVESLWASLLNQVVRPALMRVDVPAAAIDPMLTQAAQVMTGGFVAATLLSLALALLLARWWQALLYNPGGFREEFTGLRLGLPAAGVALALAAGALLSKASLMIELAMVSSVIFFLQGMAVAHAVVATISYPMAWLAGLYGLLLLALPQMMVGLATLGAVDALVDFRGRVARSRRGDR